MSGHRRTGTDAAPTFRSALHHRDFRLLLLGHGAGTVAQLMMVLAVGIEALDRTSSSMWVSVTVALGFVPYVVFSGDPAGRHHRRVRGRTRRPLVPQRGAALLVRLESGLRRRRGDRIAAGLAGPGTDRDHFAAVLATPSYPALAAATPECVADEQLPPANALVTGVENAAWIAGPGAFGVVVLAGYGPTIATTSSAALFALAALLAARVRLPRPAGGPAADGLLAELFTGLRLVAIQARIRRPMTVAVIDNFLYGYLVVALVLLAERGLGGPDAVGWLSAGLSGGALAAMAVVNRLASHRRPALVLFAVMAAFAVSVAFIGLSGSLPPAVAFATLAGAATLIAEVIAVTLLQRAAPDDVVARVFGVYDQLNVGAIAVGSLIAGPLADQLGAGTAIVVVAVGCFAASSVATATMRGRQRTARHSVEVAAPASTTFEERRSH